MVYISTTTNGNAIPNNDNGNGRHSDKSPRVALVVWHHHLGSSFDELTNVELGAICGVSANTIWLAKQLDNDDLFDIIDGHGTVSARYKQAKRPPATMADVREPAELLFGYLS